MAYSAEISRANPGCVLFLVDRSGSMSLPYEGVGTKADYVADVLNKTLQNLISKSAREDGVRDYFDVGVIGYGDEGSRSALSGALTTSLIHPISSLEKHPLRLEARQQRVPDGVGGLVELDVKFPVWFESRANGSTPMCDALVQAAAVLSLGDRVQHRRDLSRRSHWPASVAGMPTRADTATACRAPATFDEARAGPAPCSRQSVGAGCQRPLPIFDAGRSPFPCSPRGLLWRTRCIGRNQSGKRGRRRKSDIDCALDARRQCPIGSPVLDDEVGPGIGSSAADRCAGSMVRVVPPDRSRTRPYFLVVAG